MDASLKEIPCLARFFVAFLGSHWNFTPSLYAQRPPAQHSGSAAKAASNDCPHEGNAKGALLAAFVSCIPLFDGMLISPSPSLRSALIRPDHGAPTVPTFAPGATSRIPP